MSPDEKLFICLLAMIAGLWLLSKPRCNRGCKTVAEHLLTDGLDGAFAALLG